MNAVPVLPTPIGVFYREERPTYDGMANLQVQEATAKLGEGDLESLLNEGETWENIWKTCGSDSGAMPMPESRTRKMH